MEGTTRGRVHVISRRMVRPSTPPPAAKEEEVEVMHLNPLDLRLIRTDYLQKGILLPNPPPVSGDNLINALESSFARALARFYPFAGRLAADEHGNGTVTVTLRCTGEGAEFVHAAAPEIAAADIVSSIYTPSFVRDELHSFDPALGADAAVKSLPLVSVQVTELADGVFVGVTLNHAVADGAPLWNFLNTWSEIHRRGVSGDENLISTPAPVLRRWFEETWPVPIPLPFAKLEDITRQAEQTVVKECFLTFSGESVMTLTSQANDEIIGTATATITGLQATMAHLWRAVCRARRLPREQRTSYTVVIDCRGRMKEILPRGYVGNAEAFGKAEATAGEVEEKGLGWTAWQMNRAMASFDEASFRESVDTWVRRPEFLFITSLTDAGTAVATGSSSSVEVFGNDFGWGKPVAVRSGAGNKTDGKAAVFEELPERGGGWSVELCLATDALERLVADEEFMDAVSLPA